jgi:TolB-like protein
MTSRITIILLTVAVLVCLGAGSLWADEPSRVAITPFKVNADRDLCFLRDGIVDMLTTRLSWEGKVIVIQRETTQNAMKKEAGSINKKVACQIGAGLGADYVLYGSLRIFRQSVSVDAKMIDVHGVKPSVTFFDQSHGMDMVILNQLHKKSSAGYQEMQILTQRTSFPATLFCHIFTPRIPKTSCKLRLISPAILLGSTKPRCEAARRYQSPIWSGHVQKRLLDKPGGGVLNIQQMCQVLTPPLLFGQSLPVIIPESFGPWKGRRWISFTPALANMSVICFSE